MSASGAKQIRASTYLTQKLVKGSERPRRVITVPSGMSFLSGYKTHEVNLSSCHGEAGMGLSEPIGLCVAQRAFSATRSLAAVGVRAPAQTASLTDDNSQLGSVRLIGSRR